MSADLTNAMFYIIATVMACLNIHALARDKSIAGVSLVPNFFYIAWGIWNLKFYDAMAMPYSLVSSCLLLLASATWLAGALVFKRRSQ